MARARDEDIDNELLISEVEMRPALYNKSLKEYADANLKRILWEEVCENVFSTVWTQLSADQKTQAGVLVQRRWKNLRTCFSRELREQKSARSLQSAKKRRKYRYYDELLFLLPFLQVRETALQVLETSGNSESVVSDKEEEEIEVRIPSNDLPNNRKRKNYEEGLKVILSEKKDSSDTIDSEKYFAENNCEKSRQDILLDKNDSSDNTDSEKHFAGNNCEEIRRGFLLEKKDSSNTIEGSRQNILREKKDSSDIIDSKKHFWRKNDEESRPDILRTKKDSSDITDSERHFSRKNYEGSRQVILRKKKDSSEKHFARKGYKENRQDILWDKRDFSDIDSEKHFVLSLVPMLKALPPHLKLDVQIQILQVFRNIHNQASP